MQIKKLEGSLQKKSTGVVWALQVVIRNLDGAQIWLTLFPLT